jgi:hypothetical protein
VACWAVTGVIEPSTTRASKLTTISDFMYGPPLV